MFLFLKLVYFVVSFGVMGKLMGVSDDIYRVGEMCMSPSFSFAITLISFFFFFEIVIALISL